jgi:Xaa-Pro aminopeptidase
MPLTRLDRLRSLFAKEKVDCLLVSGMANIRYLTGFTGSNALLLVIPGYRWLFPKSLSKDWVRNAARPSPEWWSVSAW